MYPVKFVSEAVRHTLDFSTVQQHKIMTQQNAIINEPLIHPKLSNQAPSLRLDWRLVMGALKLMSSRKLPLFKSIITDQQIITIGVIVNVVKAFHTSITGYFCRH